MKNKDLTQRKVKVEREGGGEEGRAGVGEGEEGGGVGEQNWASKCRD